MSRDALGAPLVPGHNVDPVDLEAGLRMLASLGYEHPNQRMEVEYNLMRHARGEEAQAQQAMARSLSGVSLTSWYVVLAAAVATRTAALGPAQDHGQPRPAALEQMAQRLRTEIDCALRTACAIGVSKGRHGTDSIPRIEELGDSTAKNLAHLALTIAPTLLPTPDPMED